MGELMGCPAPSPMPTPEPGAAPSGSVGQSNPFGFVMHGPAATPQAKADGQQGAGTDKKRKFGAAGGGGGAPGSGAGGSGSADNKKNKVGRPRRDVLAEMNRLVKEFEDSSEGDSTWYGDNFKTRERNAKRLLQDVEARIQAEGCSAQESVELGIAKKKVHGVINLCKFIVASTMDAELFGATFDEQQHFLCLEPKAVVIFPGFMTRKRHNARI